MQSTLKSLLITTVLTLPTVFGAPALLKDERSGSQQATESVSIVSLHQRVNALKKIDRPQAAARVVLESLNNSRILWFNIILAANWIEQLGYPDLAASAYERSNKHPNTEIFHQQAAKKIARLKQLPSQHPKSTLHLLPVDLVMSITGFTGNDRIDIGFLNVNDLSVLTLVSTGWHAITQPLLNVANCLVPPRSGWD